MDLDGRWKKIPRGRWGKTWLLAMFLFLSVVTAVFSQEPRSTTSFIGSTTQSTVRADFPPAAPRNLRIVTNSSNSPYRAEVTLAWDPNPEPNIEGYKLYYNDASGPPYDGNGASEGDSPITIFLSSLGDADSPSFTFSGLADTSDTYFAATAFDDADNESWYSNEVIYTHPDTTQPLVNITSPTSNTTYSTADISLAMGGTASDNVGVTHVDWSNSRGGSGESIGTTIWTTTPITLYTGENIITVTASDGAGNTGEDTLTVTCSYPNECPDCSGDQVSLENLTFLAGTDCTCIGTASMTIGTNVTVKGGATVIIRAPEIHILEGFHAEEGASIRMSNI